MSAFLFLLNAVMAAIDFAVYAGSHHTFNLAAAIISTLVALFMLAMAVTE